MQPVVLKVYQAVARALMDNGVDTMFGLQGAANLFMADSFERELGGRFISAAHEAGAACMALGYSLVAGKPGVCSVTAGPGVTNTITALVEGVKGQVPMVLLCGETAAADLEDTQKIDHRPFILAAGAGYERLRSPETVGADIARTLRRAWVERRPIALSVPIEFDWEDVQYRPVRGRMLPHKPEITEGEELDNAIGIIAAARCPVILAGRGASSPEAKDAILRLAHRIDAPVFTTLKAKDLFFGQDRNMGVFGTLSSPAAVDVIMASDCLISFGASLNYRTTSRGTFLKGKRVVQVNPEPGEVGRNVAPDAGLIGDPVSVANLLVHWLDEAEIPSSMFYTAQMGERLAIERAELAAEPVVFENGTVSFRPALEALERMLPADRVLVTDTGRNMPITCSAIRASDPRAYVTSTNFGSIGLGFSHAIGACCAGGGRPVVIVNGDGSFIHGGLVEFNTAVRHRLDLIVIVANDGSYGSEENIFRGRSVDPVSSFFTWPEFADLAISLGGEGVVVRSEGDLENAARAILNRSKPLLIDIKIDAEKMALAAH